MSNPNKLPPKGVIIKPPSPTDFIAGGISGITYQEINPSGDWTAYLPSNEKQIATYFDTLACVSFSALNSIETQINFLIAAKLISVEQITKLNELGYLDENGKFNGSDRFTAKMSGTTKEGNYLQKVADSLRHDGILPEKDWTYDMASNNNKFVWEDYYQEIPQELKDKAKKFLELFEIQYEWVSNDLETLKKQLKQAPLQVATGICPGWNDIKVIQKCDLPVSHATIIYNIASEINDYDSYPPYLLKLALDYKLPWVLKILVNPLTKNNMFYGIDQNKDQWLYIPELKIAFSIADEKELANLKKSLLLSEVLLKNPPVETDLSGYTIYRGATEQRLKEFFNLK